MPGSFCAGKRITRNLENLQGLKQYFGTQNGKRVWAGRRTASLMKESSRFGSLGKLFHVSEIPDQIRKDERENMSSSWPLKKTLEQHGA